MRDPGHHALAEAFARLMDAHPDERAALLIEIRQASPEVGARVGRLVDLALAATQTGHPLANDAIDQRREALENDGGSSFREPRSAVAGYTIERLLGEGGMGSVYLATQERPARQVALKLVKSEFSSDRALRRFELEAETLGRLRHPGIAQIFEAGLHEGRPFFAMEYVEGLTLTEYAEAKKLGMRERLKLIAQVAAAVQHAHQQGVIHRDLKPGNIMVTEVEADHGRVPQPKVLDFGVAKVTESDIRATTLQTDIGQLVGTVPYMSPEQAGGDPKAVDTRSDVYALGVVAFELLTGRLPHDLTNRLVHEAVRIIREDEPSRLSSIDKALRGDIETIIAKALEKEPARRYESASALAGDIGRYLDDQPIQARPASTWYQVRKFSQRNRALVGGVAATIIVLVAGVIGTTLFAVRADAARADADQSAAQAETALEAQTMALEEADTARAKTAEALEAERERAAQLRQVSDFRAKQFERLDPAAMGADLETWLLRSVPGAERDGVADAIEGVNFVDIGLDALLTHVFEPSMETIDAEFQDQPLVRAELLHSLGRTMVDLGLQEAAKAPIERSHSIRLAQLGADAPDTLASDTARGRLLWLQGDAEQAEVIFRDVLERAQRALGMHDEISLLALSNLGSALLSQNRMDEAEAVFREALEGRERLLGETHRDTLAAMNQMGGLAYQRGDYAVAEKLLRAALIGYREVLGEEHPDTLDALSNLAAALFTQGRPDEAEPLMRQALELSLRTLGERHPGTLGAQNSLAALYRSKGDLAESSRLYLQVLEGMEQAVGANHPNVVMTHCSLCLVYLEMGETAAAAEQSSMATERGARAFPPGHPLLGRVTEMEARVALAEGRFEEAATTGSDAYATLSGALGPSHSLALGVTRFMVSCYEQWDEAEPDAGHDATAAEWQAKLPAEESADSAASE
ncbi:MAG: serine/threonine-protein kinase [Planctomycetota bacterium]